MGKTTWTKEMFEAKRRQQGVPLKANLPTQLPERVYEQGRELAMMMQVPMLDWPATLYGDKPKTDEHKCAYSTCGKPHKNAVSRVVQQDGPYGYNRRIAWYCSQLCRNRHAGLVAA